VASVVLEPEARRAGVAARNNTGGAVAVALAARGRFEIYV
jgi:hypothetical protein